MPFDASPSPKLLARDRMIRLRDFLATLPPERFDMNYWWKYNLSTGESPSPHTCGTTACIGGWANILFYDDGYERASNEVGALLGLTPKQTEKLFFDWPDTIDPTLPQAIAVLDHYLLTGKITWSVAL